MVLLEIALNLLLGAVVVVFGMDVPSRDFTCIALMTTAYIQNNCTKTDDLNSYQGAENGGTG